MNSNWKFKSIITIVLILLTYPLCTQTSSFRNVNSDGIVDFQVNSLFKDSEGFIWTGGTFLVQRFDGKYVKTYDIPSKIKKINTINEDDHRTLYFGTSHGLFALQRNGDKLEPVLPNYLSKQVYSIHIDSLNTIYVGTEEGFTIISNGNIETIQVRNSDFPFNQIISVKQTSDHMLWLLTPGGIISYNLLSKNTDYYHCLKYTDYSYCTDMTIIDSTFFIGTKGSGIITFNSETGEIKPFINIGNGSITCISTNNKTKLYVGTAGTGVFCINVPEKKIYRSFSSIPESIEKLSSGMITTLLVDDFGILWVGSAEHLGFDYIFLDPKPFSLYSTPFFTTQNVPINQFYIGDDFKLLTGLYGVYFVSEKDSNVQFLEVGIGKSKSLKPGNILSIIPYKNHLLLGGTSGIYLFNSEELSIIKFTPLRVLSNATVYHLTNDSHGNIWIASSKGIFVLNIETNMVIMYNTLNSNLPDDEVCFIYFDRRGNTWICTEKGICFYNKQQKDFYYRDFPKSFIHKNRIHYIMEDHKGNFVFCYDTRKVMYSTANFDQLRNVCTEEDAGFTGLSILKVLQEKSGDFWFIGSRGGIRANESLTHYEIYSVSEGLLEPYATDGHFDNEGNLWLSDNQGLYFYTGKHKRLNAPIVITDIEINGNSQVNELNEKIENNEPLIFNRNQNNIEFQFALLDYTRPDLMVYECKLIGVDNGWNILRGQNKIEYKNLASGKYNFVVRHNMDKNTTREVQFEIKPFLSNLYILGIVSLLIFSGWLFYLIKKRKYQSIKALQQKPPKKNNIKEEKYRFNKVSQEEAHTIIVKLNRCMNEKQLFLNERLKISDLAKEVGCSNQTLSQVFNVFMNQKYYDFINHYRIVEFKRIVSSTDHSIYTIKSLAQKSGFLSYTSFYRAFKEQTGITPNEFIQNLHS